MKAVVYRNKNLLYCEVPTPVPGPDQVLVRVVAVSVNALDLRMMQLGLVPRNRIYGADISGVVEQIGSNVKLFKPKDLVVGELSGCGLGGFAEYVVVKEHSLVHKPDSLSHKLAAGLPVAGITACKALLEKGGLQEGAEVLICGAGGGVGSFAVQIACFFKARLSVVCSSQTALSLQSCQIVEHIDYSHQRFRETNRRFDLVIAANGNYPLRDFSKILKPGGICVMTGGSFSQILRFVFLGPFWSTGKKKFRALSFKTRTEDLRKICDLAVAGCVRTVIAKEFCLKDTALALDFLKKGHVSGKVIINIDRSLG